MAGLSGSPCGTRARSVAPKGDAAGGWIWSPDGRARPASSSVSPVSCASRACKATSDCKKSGLAGVGGVLARLSLPASAGVSAAGSAAAVAAAAVVRPAPGGRRYEMTTGPLRSDRVRRSMASSRKTSRSCASSSVKGTMGPASRSVNVSPVVGSKAGVTCPPVSCAPSAASCRAAAAASSAARLSMSCTRAPSCALARSPAIPSGSTSDSGSVGTVEKHDCTRNAPPRIRANTSRADPGDPRR